VPALARSDGIELQWDSRGDSGPAVILTVGTFTHPSVYEDLLRDLARDHRVVSYDARGTGRSTRSGPYDIATDTADLAAVAAEVGGDVIVFAVGNSGNAAVHAAHEKPALVRAVVMIGGVPLPRSMLNAGEGLIASESVIQMLFEQGRRDYRGAMNAMTASFNPQLSEREVHQRVATLVAYSPQETTLARAEAWDTDDASEASRAIGERLWVLRPSDDPWLAASALPLLKNVLPDAHVVELEGGPLSRPDLTAEVVRSVTGAAG
jgi:pimeloyl-ACP methyl ester carboxylesterase